ncbi:MAG: SRPBCC domain-containing protein [Acidobacteria bacterium]|nr:SRPBCC domain-containing protein [Acidobacteriota bacterium]
MFQAWADPEHLVHWWGPKYFTNSVCEVDARERGTCRIVMRAPDGTEYPGRGVYREFVPPERLVFTNVAEDKDPLLDGLTTVTFENAGGKTKLTVETRAIGRVEIAEWMLDGMEAGWTQSLRRLAELLTARA